MHDFGISLEWSKSRIQTDSDAEAIMHMLDGCVSVTQSSLELDRRGVDYIATLRKGAEVMIDAKARRQGASRARGFDSEDPLLAIEKWSVCPGGKYNLQYGKAGWTISESTIADMILFTFHPEDSQLRFLLPFQPLRMAARKFMDSWGDRFGWKIQDNQRYESQAVFVPASEVIAAMETTYSATITS